MGFPTDTFTVLFAIGRAQDGYLIGKNSSGGKRIHRPRQVYRGVHLGITSK